VTFISEQGIDCGGLTKEWFSILSAAMINPQYSLFRSSEVDPTFAEPNSFSRHKIQHKLFFLPSWIRKPKHLDYYSFFGRVFGLALSTRNHISIRLKNSFYEELLGKTVTDETLMIENQQYFDSLHALRGIEVNSANLDLFFCVNERDEVTNKITTEDLIYNGRNIPVTDTNKEKYIAAMKKYKLRSSVSPIMDAFKSGFYEVIPLNIVSHLSAKDLSLLIAGSDRIDVDDWQKHSVVNTNLNSTHLHVPLLSDIFYSFLGYTSSNRRIAIKTNVSEVSKWFWTAVHCFSEADRKLLLRFVTGSSSVPFGGFAHLHNTNSNHPFTVLLRPDFSIHHLPTSHTCFNRLDLPLYNSYEELHSKLLTAVREGADHFGIS